MAKSKAAPPDDDDAAWDEVFLANPEKTAALEAHVKAEIAAGRFVDPDVPLALAALAKPGRISLEALKAAAGL